MFNELSQTKPLELNQLNFTMRTISRPRRLAEWWRLRPWFHSLLGESNFCGLLAFPHFHQTRAVMIPLKPTITHFFFIIAYLLTCIISKIDTTSLYNFLTKQQKPANEYCLSELPEHAFCVIQCTHENSIRLLKITNIQMINSGSCKSHYFCDFGDFIILTSW